MERFGIVGLPNAGKSSLFNALTGGNAQVAAHPFSTTETNVGVAKVPDHRLDALAGDERSRRRSSNATAEFVDIAGIQKGSNAGEGLGNKFLGGIREVDATLYVLRSFVDPNVVGGSDPLDDLATLELELVLADAASAETQLERRRKAAKSDKSLAGEVAVLEKAVESPAGGDAALPRRAVTPTRSRRCSRTSSSPRSRCSSSSTSATISSTRPMRSSRRWPASSAVPPTCSPRACSWRRRPRSSMPDERAELLDGLGLGEGRVARA